MIFIAMTIGLIGLLGGISFLIKGQLIVGASLLLFSVCIPFLIKMLSKTRKVFYVKTKSVSFSNEKKDQEKQKKVGVDTICDLIDCGRVLGPRSNCDCDCDI